MEAQPEASTSGRPVVKLFPGASQPSIIRAEQKDELYLQYLVDSCHDVVRRLLGPRAALLWGAETKVLAELLYYALTTGTGNQTLGEEYCDILQAMGAMGGPPGAARRGVLVLLQALGPYVARRLESPVDDDLAAWQTARWQAQQAQQAQQQGDVQGAARGHWRELWLRARASARALHQRAADAAADAAAPLARRFPQAAGFLREHWGSLLRVHLALFYLHGTYLQPSKRLAGVRYIFMGRSFERRPSYHVLGLLLCAQIVASASLWVLRTSGGMQLLRGAGGGQQGKLQHAEVLAEGGREVASSSEAHGSSAAAGQEGAREVPSSRKCPLCLSVRACPTATPCGHVFCWQCITEWCNQKAECPLCRAEVLPSLLVPVQYASEF